MTKEKDGMNYMRIENNFCVLQVEDPELLIEDVDPTNSNPGEIGYKNKGRGR